MADTSVIERTSARAGSVRHLVAPVVLGLALLQALWILSVPPFRALDEFDHAYRASAVAHGQWRATALPEDGRGLLVNASSDIVRAAHDECAALDYTRPDNCTAAGPERDGLVPVVSGAATYHPVFYWVVGTAALPFDGVYGLYAMRVAAALLCLLFLALAALAVSTWRRPGWGLTALVLAASPVLLFSTSVPAPNGLEMCSALAMWAALLAIGDEAVRRSGHTGRLLLVAGVSGVVLCSLRQLGPLFVVMILAACLVVSDRGTIREVLQHHRRRVVTMAGLVAAAAAGSAAWILVARAGAHQPDAGEPALHATTVVLWQLQSIAAFPYRNSPGPILIYPVVLVAVGILLVSAFRSSRGRERLGLVAVLAAMVLLPLVLTLVTQGTYGTIWQGRYGLPFSVGFVLVSGLVLSRRAARPGPSPRLLPVALALAGGYAACYVKLIRDEIDRAMPAQDPSWLPMPVWVPVAGTVVAWVLISLALGRLLEPEGEGGLEVVT